MPSNASTPPVPPQFNSCTMGPLQMAPFNISLPALPAMDLTQFSGNLTPSTPPPTIGPSPPQGMGAMPPQLWPPFTGACAQACVGPPLLGPSPGAGDPGLFRMRPGSQLISP